MPFKDVFRADPDVAGANGEPEALLSALSTGPVALGDRVGRFDPALALRTCRSDGILVKPDVPIAATGESMLNGAAFRSELLVAECFSDHEAGRWAYVLGLHANPSDEPVTGTIALAGLGECAPRREVVAWDWRAGTATRMPASGTWSLSLDREGWAYLVLAPVLASGIAVIGDTSKFVPAGDARIEVSATASGARLVVKGAGERVTITGWSEAAPSAGGRPVAHDPATGVWTVPVEVPARGWAVLDVAGQVPRSTSS
jgi:hypothetical protein